MPWLLVARCLCWLASSSCHCCGRCPRRSSQQSWPPPSLRTAATWPGSQPPLGPSGASRCAALRRALCCGVLGAVPECCGLCGMAWRALCCPLPALCKCGIMSPSTQPNQPTAGGLLELAERRDRQLDLSSHVCRQPAPLHPSTQRRLAAVSAVETARLVDALLAAGGLRRARTPLVPSLPPPPPTQPSSAPPCPHATTTHAGWRLSSRSHCR
jgi:hypothetical protein